MTGILGRIDRIGCVFADTTDCVGTTTESDDRENDGADGEERPC